MCVVEIFRLIDQAVQSEVSYIIFNETNETNLKLYLNNCDIMLKMNVQ